MLPRTVKRENWRYSETLKNGPRTFLKQFLNGYHKFKRYFPTKLLDGIPV